MPLIPPNRVTVFPLKDELQWYDPDVIFKPFDDIFGRGVIGSTDLQVIQNGASGDSQISIKAGRGYVPYSGGGKRLFQTSVDIRSDAAEFITPVPSWGGGNPRVHRIIARIRDATLNAPDVIKGGLFDVLPGTATAGANLTNLSGAQAVPADSLLLGNLLQDSAVNPTAKIDSTFGTVRARARIGAGVSPTKGFQVAGAALTDRGWLNFIEGTGIDISAVDNPGNDSADLTIASTFSIPLVTALPGSPVDGQLIRFQADLANGVVWLLVYIASASGSYKWFFLGGPPLIFIRAGADTFSSTSYDDAGSPVAVTIPAALGGDFDVDSSVGTWNFSNANLTASSNAFCSPKIGTAAANDADGVQVQVGTPYFTASHRKTRHTAVSAGAVITQRYKLTVALGSGDITIARRTIAVTPVRVG